MAAAARRRRRRPVARGRAENAESSSSDLCFVVALVGLLVAGLAALLYYVVLAPYAGPHYLYRGDKDTGPVIEYYVGNAEEWDEAETRRSGDSIENDASSPPPYPDFLNSTDLGPRVVEFYAPWCPHCKHFKPKYVAVARTVQSTEAGKGVTFHAVSCTAHRDVCKTEGVKSFPTVKFFRAGNNTGQLWWNHKMTPDDVLEQLGLAPPRSTDEEGKRPGSSSAIATERKLLSAAVAGAASRGGHRMDVPSSFPQRAQSDIFMDAALSFDFALRNSVYTALGPLSSDERSALKEWLELVRRVAPLGMMPSVDEQTEALLDNFDYIANDHVALKDAINNMQPAATKWSVSCTRGDDYAGYTCGLWDFFHVLTIGVAEWNAGGSSRAEREEENADAEIVSTAHAANVLRNYIENFFGCQVCRENFIEMYDACAFDRCARLSTADSTAAASSDSDSWKELALWLWETHNDVNVRLLRERAERDKKAEPDESQVWAVRWPSVSDCPHCWNADGTFDGDVTYWHLRSEYWPVENDVDRAEEGRRREVHLGMALDGDFAVGSKSAPRLRSTGLIFGAIVCVFAVWWLVMSHEKRQSGRHKKIDSASHSVLPL